ncbi:CTP synthetase [Marinosulfonomonas sp. PRT-SC04]|nr:CTP synthetase [Marinosulfonomonas sp. PRT-SC04]
MLRLTLLMYSILSGTLAGTAIIAVLVAGYGTKMPIIYAALAGFLVAIPISWLIAKKISD